MKIKYHARVLPLLLGLACMELSSAQTTNRAPNLVDPAVPPPPEAPADSRDSTPDATLKLQGGSVAAGIGFVWGHGTVNYQGLDHSFDIHGVSVVDVGGASISATGVVMNLKQLKDLAGKYVAWGAGITIAGGGSAVYMKNQNGVVIKLISHTEGLRFNLSGNGIRLTLRG
jgi:hypothetical protein